MAYLWIALGSALGGVGRFWMSSFIATRVGETFPWGTLAVNILGSFLIGVVAAIAAPESRVMISPGARQFLMLGCLGGFTTFSSFSLQTLNLAADGEWLLAAANAVGSVLLCLIGVWLGFTLASRLALS